MAMVNIADSDICSVKDCRMLLQIHDELLFEISPARIKEVIPQIVEIMEGVAKLDVAMTTEVKQGNNCHTTEMKKSKCFVNFNGWPDPFFLNL